jgi:hypothetical protein
MNAARSFSFGPEATAARDGIDPLTGLLQQAPSALRLLDQWVELRGRHITQEMEAGVERFGSPHGHDREEVPAGV